jgi:hypothetical protein
MPTAAQAPSEQATAEVLRNFWSMLPRRFFFDDMPDKGLFAGVATLGFVLILVLKIEALGPELVCALAVALMLAYGVAAYRIPSVRLRLDRLGDNFYYLGFIYTLASLSAALVQMRNGIEIDAVLGNFGVALITTIVGIAGRVVFVQMRSEIDDVEEVIRRDILEAASALKGQLSGAIEDFDTFRTGLRQIAKETLQESADYGTAHIQKIAAVAEAAAARINTAFDEKKLYGEELIKVNIKLAAAVDDLMFRMEKVDLPTEHLASRLNSFTSALEQYLQQLGKAVSAVVNLATPKRRRWRWWRNRSHTNN